MIINPDNTFRLEEGERIPFICPNCAYPVQFEEAPIMIRCLKCNCMDFREAFIVDVMMRDVKEGETGDVPKQLPGKS